MTCWHNEESPDSAAIALIQLGGLFECNGLDEFPNHEDEAAVAA